MIKFIRHYIFLRRTKKALKKLRMQRKREERYVALLRKLLAQKEAHDMLKARAEDIVAVLFDDKRSKAGSAVSQAHMGGADDANHGT